jgi:protein-disulfide isomerase
MSGDTVRRTRRQRRAADLAARRTERREPTTRPKRRFGLGAITAVAIVGGLAIVGFMALTRPQPAPSPTAAVIPAAVPAGLVSSGFTLGKADAPVAIDVYEDFQCPACMRWGRDVFPSLARNELADGRAKLVFHGDAFIGPESRDALRAAWAASRQNRFWDYWATLYANQGSRENGGSFTRERLVSMADAIGLEPTMFGLDYESDAAQQAVMDGIADAQRAGVQSTPTVFVNGQRFTGATYPDLSTAIAGAKG